MSSINDFAITRLSTNDQEAINAFLSTIFSDEQYIPRELIPIDSDEVYWWGVIGRENEILGVAATWKEEDEWHWGRFSIHPRLRGKGLGKKLAEVSLHETFELDIPYLTIDARDVTIHLIKNFGGEICGKPVQFYSENVTPMKLEKHNFKAGS